MMCLKPITKIGTGTLSVPVSCGKCLPCRIRKKMVWTTRNMLESRMHESSVFITLTYDDNHLPANDYYHGGSLYKKDLQQFFKSLKQALARKGSPKIRYYAVGEYGDQSQRAHYHALIYGISYEDADELIDRIWDKGYTYTRPFLRERAAYVCGYTTKKLEADRRKLDGRKPMFQIQSMNPGIGVNYIEHLADYIVNRNKTDIIHDGFIRIDGKMHYLGKFLINKLDQEIWKLTGEYKTYLAKHPDETIEIDDIHDQRRVTDIMVKQLERRYRQKENEMRAKYGKGT